jgi:clan AA aspartic protease (TIGR02281 family)
MTLLSLFSAIGASLGLAPHAQVVSSVDTRVAQPVSAPFDTERAPDSLFYVRGAVSGGAIDFAIDSGASLVVLTPADARRIGITGSASTVGIRTAAGRTAMKRITIDRLEIAGRVLRDVDAVIAPTGNVSLLGQSALSRFETVTFAHNRATLD